MFKISIGNNEVLELPRGSKLNDILEVSDTFKGTMLPIVLGKFNEEILELTTPIYEDGEFSPIYTSEDIARRTYVRTLLFVLIKATLDLFPKAQVIIEHSISKGIFGEIHKDIALSTHDVLAIKKRMKKIIDEDIEIHKVAVALEDALAIFREYGMEDKVRLLESLNIDKVKLYELDGRYDYFYGPMAYSTGVLRNFDLVSYESGFLLRYPTLEDPLNLPKLQYYKKLNKIFKETEKWGNIMNVPDVGSLNSLVQDKSIAEMIRVNEGLQEKKIAYIADSIAENKHIKLVLIAGPSSSGKTTFTKRLGIQLRANGIVPVEISMDDFFVDRENNPRDENGEYDFESIYSIDIELFNKTLNAILNGETVEIPTYNFKTGKREWHGHTIKLQDKGIILIEGIHGLNELLSNSIPKKNKFKIYISCLTQLNIDNHNRISTTDVRMVRRIVRDSLSRGYSAEDTLKMWPSIRRGEDKNIFIFQEEADVMFNSNLVYELCVLKKYALKELEKITKDSPVYYEALRIISFLHFFDDVEELLVPDTSLLREFIGGSFFYKY